MLGQLSANNTVKLTNDRLLMPLFIIGIYCLSWIMQTQMLINWDVSWLMHAPQKLLAGGTYSKDFFELNPTLF